MAADLATAFSTARVRAEFRSGVPVVAAVAVAAQVAYPLTHGGARSRLTIAIVGLVAALSLLHAWTTRGARTALALAAATTGFGFAVELVGVHSGYPFGRYAYAGSLGPRLLGVPLVIAFAWTMLAWPAALAARRLVSSFAARVALGAWALASWDVFLDPQMVAAGRWHWADASAHLPGVPGVPLSDYAGWLAVSLVVSSLLQRTLRDAPPVAPAGDRVVLGFYVWTWLSSALALAVFLRLPAAGAWGAVAMGTVAVPVAGRMGRSALPLRRR
jgi:putative membrane protein